MENKKRFVIEYVDLMQNWDWDKNNELGLFPDKITFGCNKKVWWKCTKCGHSWLASPNNRTNGQTGCPCCAGRVVVRGKNDLQTKFPEIAKRWHPTKNSKKPWEVTAFSNQKAWFVCEKDERHIFEARINHITHGEIICPVCANQQIIVGLNDFQTTNLELMYEWNWEKNNNIGIFPTQITRGYNKRVWWKCKTCGYEWQATVASRSGKIHTGCPQCVRYHSSSFAEKAVAYYLAKCFDTRENVKWPWLGNGELDIYIDQLNLAIEYDGQNWHKSIERDLMKDNLCEINGIHLVRIRESECPYYQSSSHKIVCASDRVSDLTNSIALLFEYIYQRYRINFDIEIDVAKDYTEILSKIATGIKKNSIASTDLINSWDYNKNCGISPESISLGSDRKVWWKCEKGHSWQATVSSRSGKEKCGCPYCAGQRVIPGENDLETLYPKIAKEWDYNKNIKKPSEVMSMDNRKYWWICPQCGNSYQSSPSHRAGRGGGCPACARARTIASHFKKVVNIDTNEVYDSINEASIATGANARSISNCCRGKRKTAGGYHWKFFKNQ